MTTAGWRWTGCVALTAVFGYALQRIGLAGGWLIGAMLAAAVLAFGTGGQLVPRRQLVRLAQGVIGVLTALPLTQLRGTDVIGYLGLAVVSILITLGISIGCGLWLTRASGGEVTPNTGILAMIAGGASTVSTIADQLGADQRYVSLSQYLRLLVVTATLPVVIPLLGATGGVGHAGGPTGDAPWTVSGVIALAVVIVCAGPVGERLRVPAPYLLAPLLVALVLGLAAPGGAVPQVPEVVKEAAYVLVGWQAGGSFSRAAMALFVRLLPRTLLFIAVTIGGCFAVAAGTSAWCGIPLTDAYLATSPGGIYGVLAISHDIGSGPVVATLQVLRMVVMLLAAVALPEVIRRAQERRRGGGRPGGKPVPVPDGSRSTPVKGTTSS
ncbi:AbrB family transcriptional regulator [Streptomyces sp. CT34]|uniref:AbrB family transcriptional regulator n=1 Tax=Streptomyces sp. CT34 TaxID=1553907 RepID=UPI00068E7C98|nr:AbrB family transcriptional regulator [Streptomyces sp. CT34]